MQKVLVRGVRGIELNNVRDGNAVLIRRYQFDSITGRDFSFRSNGKVEPIATAVQKPFDYICPAEADTKLEARHAGLGNNKLCRADVKPVADMNGFVVERALGSEVFAESSPREVNIRKFIAPERIVF
jgi:hypothetical protein